MDRLSQAIVHARMKARDLYLVNPKHKLILLLVVENESSEEEESHWDELCKIAHERFHIELNLVKVNDQITLWREIAQLLSEAIFIENRNKQKKHYETLVQEEKRSTQEVDV